jgi:hypothetical protein
MPLHDARLRLLLSLLPARMKYSFPSAHERCLAALWIQNVDCLATAFRQGGPSRAMGIVECHVPTRSGAFILRKVASTESATIRPVLGFSEGTFSIDMLKLAESDTTSIV